MWTLNLHKFSTLICVWFVFIRNVVRAIMTMMMVMMMMRMRMVGVRMVKLMVVMMMVMMLFVYILIFCNEKHHLREIFNTFIENQKL